MKVSFDITHPAHINLFKPQINRLIKKGIKIDIILLDRGKIIKIANEELPIQYIIPIGKWYKSTIKKIFYSNVLRSIQILFHLLKAKPNIGLSSGSVPFGFACKMLNIPNLQFSDDPERLLSTKLEILVATRKYYPPFIDRKRKVGNYNCLKQWAYLSPNVFTPDVGILKEYNLIPRSYIFVREISTGSQNYKNQSKSNLLQVIDFIPNGYKILFSLEDKSKLGDYPPDWILLKEPVNGIHSLMYFSKLIISTGDSMVREGGLLGVPSIYLGDRQMAANKILIDKNIISVANKENFETAIYQAIDTSSDPAYQEVTIDKLDKEWDDLNEFIYKKTLKYCKK